ncbi:hypothetical protein THASP1DRAFT_24746, partial [Thamnocephalis sphaerospora]
MQQLRGTLFQYHPEKPHLVAFRSSAENVHGSSGSHRAHRAVVLLAGLTEGPLSLPFTVDLNQTLGERHWHLVQPVLSSSYTGFGIRSLEQDTEELDQLLDGLFNSGYSRVVLLGHSTGSQIALYYARFGRYRSRISGCLLQGAISDRQYYRHSMRETMTEEQMNAWLRMAEDMRKSR